MQYQVPQFIETEDTIWGPITVRQFIYIAIGVGIILVSYLFFTTFLWLIFSSFVGAVTAILAFAKYNGRPITKVLFSMFGYLWKPRQYVWRRKEEVAAMRAAEAVKHSSPLQNLWLKITAGKELIPKREKFSPKSAEDRFEALEKTTGDKETARRVDYR